MVHAQGLVVLTSHRILWHSREEGRALQAHLSHVAQVRKSRNPFKSSSRVHVFLHTAAAAAANHSNANDAAAKLDFLHGGARDRDDFLEQTKHLLDLRQWERVPLPPPPTAAQQQQPGGQPPTPGGGQQGAEAPAFTTRTAGVGGIIRRQENTRAAQDRLATEAFADLSTLMDKAREVVRGWVDG